MFTIERYDASEVILWGEDSMKIRKAGAQRATHPLSVHLVGPLQPDFELSGHFDESTRIVGKAKTNFAKSGADEMSTQPPIEGTSWDPAGHTREKYKSRQAHFQLHNLRARLAKVGPARIFSRFPNCYLTS